MDLLFKILGLIALISFTMLTLVAINAINKSQIILTNFVKDFAKLAKNLDETKDKLDKALTDVSELKQKTIETLVKYDSVADQIIKTSDSVEKDSKKILNIFEPYSQLLSDVYTKIAPPVLQTSNAIRAVSKGITTFFDRLIK